MKWLPIETAPKDGTQILLYRPNTGVVRGQWNADEYGSTPRPYWTNDRQMSEGKLATRACQPTHWMPLPAPPEPEQ